MKANKIPTDEQLVRNCGEKVYINVRINKDTYYLLKDIKEVNNIKSIDATIRELVQYVAIVSASQQG